MQNIAHRLSGISFTADEIVARRLFMSIPYSQDIFGVLHEKSPYKWDKHLAHVSMPEGSFFTTFLEARHRILDKLLKKTGVKNILEVAAGFTPRGLKWTEDPLVQYVELDLPSKSKEKWEVVDNLAFPRCSTGIRCNLHLEGGDALDGDSFEGATSFFENGPVAIVNEGFLRYLSHEEKSILATNIRRMLERFGGYWITPDIDILDPRLKDPRLKSYNDQLQSELVMDVTPNLFDSVSEARGFFESLGFAVEAHSLKEILADMFSPMRLDLPMNKVENFIGQKVAFVMQLA